MLTTEQYRNKRIEEIRKATEYIERKEKEKDNRNFLKVVLCLLVFWGVVLFAIFQCSK